MDTDRKPIVQVSSLVKEFNGFRAVDNITFDVKQGEIFAFLGPNGAGKTTTIRMLTTLLKPTAGDMKVNGFDPVTEPYEVRGSFGIVFQDQSLDDELTAYENMEFHGILYGLAKKIRRERIDRLLAFVGLDERRDDLVKKFSGGMRRRLEIARGLIHTPRILFLDEPTLGLDPQTRHHIWKHIADMNEKEGVTVFLTTHYMEEAERVAGRIAIIDRGKIIQQGSAGELKERTATTSLEDAFLAITGKEIRSEDATALDRMRMRSRMWRK